MNLDWLSQSTAPEWEKGFGIWGLLLLVCKTEWCRDFFLFIYNILVFHIKACFDHWWCYRATPWKEVLQFGSCGGISGLSSYVWGFLCHKSGPLLGRIDHKGDLCDMANQPPLQQRIRSNPIDQITGNKEYSLQDPDMDKRVSNMVLSNKEQ